MIFISFFVLLASLLLCTLILLFFLVQFIAIFTTDAPFVSIPKEIEDKIIESLKLDKNSVLYDLGCGDARILRLAVEKCPEIRAVGVEVAFFPYLLARFKTRNYRNVTIRREDIFKTDTSDATVIFLYLYPTIPEKLLPILEQKGKKGTRIVSCDFEDTNRIPNETVSLDPLAKRGKKLIVYTI